MSQEIQKIRSRRGEESNSWKGGKHSHLRGYILIYQPDHSRAYPYGYVFEHILIAEKALGKPLPKAAIVHHIDENTSNNRNDNLVICQNDKYHKLLHLRMRALHACGHASWRRCTFCKEWEDVSKLKIDLTNGQVCHPKCKSDYNRKYRLAHPNYKNSAKLKRGTL